MTWWPFSTARRVKPQLSSSNVLAGYSALKAWPWPAPSARERELRTIENQEIINLTLRNRREEDRATITELTAANCKLQGDLAVAIGAAERFESAYVKMRDMNDEYYARLLEIAALDTPRASHTVKKAVAIARGQ